MKEMHVLLKEMFLKCMDENSTEIIAERNEELARWKAWSDDANKKIVCLGAAGMFGICSKYFSKLGIHIDELCCNDTSKYGETMNIAGEEIVISSVEDALKDAQNTICFVTLGAQHFDDVSKQLSKYSLAEVVMRWHLDFYLEATIMLLDTGYLFENRLAKLLDYYDDEESIKILFSHFNMLFHFKNIPEDFKDASMEKLCVRPQYFLEKGKYLEKQKTMIDCGAFIGDTLLELVNDMEYDKFDSYECFEMDDATFRRLQKNVEMLDDDVRKKVVLNNKGVGADNQEISYVQNDIGGSQVSESGESKSYIIKIDDDCKEKTVSFIKMDIEGSEQDALKGAKETIMRDKPMCAVCIYHNLAAFWEVPELLLNCVPEYHLLLRHHTTYWDDSVCYAKIGEWK